MAEAKIGVALGAGAARGWAHLGVLAALDELQLPVSCVAGTSAGALVGGAFAAGQVRAFGDIALNMDWRLVLRFFSDLSLSRSGFVDGSRITAFLREHVTAEPIEKLGLPFAAVATDLQTGTEVVLKSGDTIDAIRASISFPGIFTPVTVGGRVLVDGGLVNPVPVSAVRDLGADIVIAVDVNHDRVGSRERKQQRQHEHRRDRLGEWIGDHTPAAPLIRKLEQKLQSVGFSGLRRTGDKRKEPRLPPMFDVLGNSMRILEARVGDAMLEADPPDVLIRPDVGYISFMEFLRGPEAAQAGYEAARRPLEALAARLNGIGGRR